MPRAREALSSRGRRKEGEQEFERALELDPTNFEANLFYAIHLARGGEAERSVPYFTRALEVKPDDPQSPLLLYNVLRHLGRTEEVREICASSG